MSGRKLTSGEIAIAKRVFNNSINYSTVVIHNGKYAFYQPDNSGMTPKGEIYVHGAYQSDYSTSTQQGKAFYVHEMVHIWQYQLKIMNLTTAAIAESFRHGFDYDEAYKYTLDAAKDLLDYRIEQQASIIEDYYRTKFLSLKPRVGRMQNSYTDAVNKGLFGKVLAKFISNPKYAKHEIVCKRRNYGKPGTRTQICNRVLVK